MDNVKVLGICLLPLVIIGLGIWYEVAVWRECMTDHSWWYCARVLSH